MIELITNWTRRKRGGGSAAESAIMTAVRLAMQDVQAYARSHGGSIDLVGVDDDGNVKVRFRGACAGCPLSSVTLRHGVEERLRSLVPGVGKVVAT
jgi:Fe-S cluster biogenesis protein NfuA